MSLESVAYNIPGQKEIDAFFPRQLIFECKIGAFTATKMLPKEAKMP